MRVRYDKLWRLNHGGDSDSTGAVTGNILGASLGIEGIPQKFVENLELRDVILEIADDLYNDCKMTEYGDYYDPVWEAKYITMTYPDMQERKLREATYASSLYTQRGKQNKY